MDTLHKWQRTYRRELDEDTKQECVTTEAVLRKALAGGGEGVYIIDSLAFFKYPFSFCCLPPPTPFISV